MSPAGEAVQQRVATLARKRGISVQAQTVSFVGERFLHRLASAGLSGQFVLKGAHLFGIWDCDRRRATADVDLGHDGYMDDHGLVSCLAQVARSGWDDGVSFDPSGVVVEAAFSGAPRGCRVAIPARLGTSAFRLKVDVTFGQPVVPGPEQRWHQSSLPGMPPALVACAPKETMVAEKLAIAVEFGADNTRIRDYHDLWWLASTTSFQGTSIQHAVQRVFDARSAGRFLLRADNYWAGGLEPGFASRSRVQAWDAYNSEQGGKRRLPDFDQVMQAVSAFSMPLLHSVRDAHRIGDWSHDGSCWGGYSRNLRLGLGWT